MAARSSDDDADAVLLIAAAARGDMRVVVEMLGREDADATHWVDAQGRNALVVAAEHGHVGCVEVLMNALPWNSMDPSTGVSAGDLARRNGHETVFKTLVAAGIRTELLMNMMFTHDGQDVLDDEQEEEDADCEHVDKNVSERDGSEPAAAAPNAEYLAQKLSFETAPSGQKQLVSAERDGVMMGWEKPLMDMHAEVICNNTDGPRHILNVGFGLGLVDEAIQRFKPESHTIVEAHPDVYRHMQETGWTSKSGVRVLFGRWQDVLEPLCDREYTGIFWDTFGEDYTEMRRFHDLLPGILCPSVGVYSFFNGLCATSHLFHEVAVGVAEIDLNELGLSVHFQDVPIRDGVLSEETWTGIKRQYWSLEIYRLPICRLCES